MAALQADNTAAVALLLKRRAPTDAVNSCVRASIVIEKRCLRPAPSCPQPCHRHLDDAVSIASNFGHLHLAQALKVQTALSARAITGFKRTTGLFSRPPALLSSLRCMHRVPAVSDTREMPLQLQVLRFHCPASPVPVLSRRHPGAPAVAFAAQPSYGQALCSLTVPKTFFYRRVRPHAHGLLWRCSRASAAA